MKKAVKSVLCIVLTLITALSVSTSMAANAYALSKKEKQIEKTIDEIMKSMTLREKVAQMLVVYLPPEAKETQREQQYGGYLFFADAFESSTKDEIKHRIEVYQKVSKINMLIAVDEEGGYVVRASKYRQFRSAPYSSPRKVYENGGWDGVKNDAASKSKFLKSLGINTNFAPVADVAYNRGDFIYSRSFSTSADKTAKFIKITVKQMNAKKCISTLKHFPGYGNNGDTHTDIIVDKRSKKALEARDLKPFIQGIKAGAPMIMVSHNIVNCFDKKNPASMSKNVHKYLRNTMGFDGVIITDGLGMSGVREKYGSDAKIAILAVKAGNDMLCTPYGRTSLKAIKDAVKSGEISKERIDKSVRRILRMKLKYGIIDKSTIRD